MRYIGAMVLTPQTEARRALFARGALIALLVALGTWIVWAFLPALIWAIIVAVAVDPLVQRAESRFAKPRRNLIAVLFTVVFALIVLAPIGFGVAQAAREAHEIAAWIAQARSQGVPPPDWLASLPFGSTEVTSWWRTNLADPAVATHHFQKLGGTLLGAQSQSIGFRLLHRAVVFGFTLLALFFLIRDRDKIVAQARAVSGRLLGPQGERIGRQALLSVRGTIDGLVLVGLGEGAFMAVVYVAFGVPHPILLGIATAIAAMIPFGAVLMFAIAALLLLAKSSVGAAIAVVAIGLGVVFVADHFLRPVLIGSATRLPFLWVLIGILGGVETMGLLGLFVGPATMAVLFMLWRELITDSTSDALA